MARRPPATPTTPSATSSPARAQSPTLGASRASTGTSESRYYKIGLRYYDPSLGRWTQKDPIVGFEDPRRANRYIYAGQDPVNNIDPSGAHWLGDRWDDVSEWWSLNGQDVTSGVYKLIDIPERLEWDGAAEEVWADGATATSAILLSSSDSTLSRRTNRSPPACSQ